MPGTTLSIQGGSENSAEKDGTTTSTPTSIRNNGVLTKNGSSSCCIKIWATSGPTSQGSSRVELITP